MTPKCPDERRGTGRHHAVLAHKHRDIRGTYLLGKTVEETRVARRRRRPGGISIPVAITVFPGESYQAPRSWAEREKLPTSSTTTGSTGAATSPLGSSRNSFVKRFGLRSGRCADRCTWAAPTTRCVPGGVSERALWRRKRALGCQPVPEPWLRTRALGCREQRGSVGSLLPLSSAYRELGDAHNEAAPCTKPGQSRVSASRRSRLPLPDRSGHATALSGVPAPSPNALSNRG